MKTIDEHIQKDQEEFLKALSEHNDGKVRHLTEELQWLLDHKKEFPDDPHDPSPLELFCEQKPDEPECLVYDDCVEILIPGFSEARARASTRNLFKLCVGARPRA